jgi:hypothetical protein
MLTFSIMIVMLAQVGTKNIRAETKTKSCCVPARTDEPKYSGDCHQDGWDPNGDPICVSDQCQLDDPNNSSTIVYKGGCVASDNEGDTCEEGTTFKQVLPCFVYCKGWTDSPFSDFATCTCTLGSLAPIGTKEVTTCQGPTNCPAGTPGP